MKFILFSINDERKNIVKNLENKNIVEITLSGDLLEERLNRKNKGLGKVKNFFYDNSLKRLVIKALSGHDTKWYYLLSNKFDIKQIDYLANKFQELLGYKDVLNSEIDKNIFKHITEYSLERKIKKHEIRSLIVVSKLKNLNLSVVHSLIKECKMVNVYLNEKPTNYVLNYINKINKEEGTVVEIIRKDKKQLTEFDVVYFVDDVKDSYPRLRLNKKALIIDLNTEDKFNSNIIFLNKYMENNNLDKEKLNKYISEYGKLEFASVVKKIVN